jgi:hypothetical protein
MGINFTNFFKQSIISFLLLCSFQAKAQIVAYPLASQTLIRGYGNSLLSVKIDFPTCTDLKVTINLGATNSPGIIEYVPSSINKTAGTATITEFNITDLRNPIFIISNTTAGESVTFTINRRSECGFPISTKDNIIVTGTGSGCSFSEVNPNTNGYLLRAPALTVNAPAPITNAALNGVYTRNLSVVNGGNGITDTVRFYIVYEGGKSENNSPTDAITANGVTFTPWKTNGDTLFYKIFGATLFGTDNIFLNGETVNIVENIKVLKCDPIIKYAAQWGRNLSNICATTFGQSGITMSNSVPNLVVDLPTPDYNYCWVGETVKQTLRVTNSGGGAASNINLRFGNYFIGSFQARFTFDTITPWVIKNSAGVPVGVVKNFTSVAQRWVVNQSCAQFLGVNDCVGSFSDLIILPGETYTVEVYTISENMNCGGCQYATGWTGIQTDIRYQNQCANANYSSGATNHMTRAYMYPQFSAEIPTDIVPNVPFNLSLFFNILYNINNPNGTGTTYLALPLAGTNLLPNVSSLTFGTYTWPVFVLNDTMFVGPVPQNLYLTNTLMTIPMVATCGSGGPITINPFILNSYGSCSPKLKFGCATATTNLHCPAPCPKGGATPIKFALQRTNFGLPDNDNNGIPDGGSAILDKTKIDDHHCVNGDTLKGTWNIKVYGNFDVSDPNYGKRIFGVYLDFYLGGPQANKTPGTLTALPNATIKIYPNSNPLAVPIICSTVPTFAGTKAHYEFDSTCRGMAWQHNDSIVLEANYIANTYTNAYGFDLFNTYNEVYSTYNRKTTPWFAPTLGETYTCDHFNDYAQISRLWLSPWIPGNQIINGCTNTLISYMRQYLRFQEGPNIFPFEYRNFFLQDSMTVTLPTGFTYRPNTSTLTNYDNAYLTVTIPDANINQVGNKLYFTNLRSLYTTYGGTLTAGDETSTIWIYFKVDPTCTAVTGTYQSATHTSGLGNLVNTPFLYGTDPTIVTPQALGWIYTAPQPIISGGGLVYSSNGTASWNVIVQNFSPSIIATNSYIAITPAGNFTNIIVKEGATVLTAVNGIYKLSNLVGNANRILTVTATASNCNLDSLRVNYSWDCNTYPNSISAIGCTKSVWLKMDYTPSQIQLYVDKQPTSPDIPLCDVDDIEFIFNSAQTSNVNNPQIRIVPPVGAIINSAELEYPLGSGNKESITPTISGGVYIYNLEDHSLILPDGLLGTASSPLQPGRAAKLYINYATTCRFSSGSRFFAQIRGDRPCGGQIPVSQGYNAFLRTEPIFITGSPAGSLFSFNLGLSSNVVSCGQTRISGSVTPVGGPSTNTDTILVTIPSGLSYSGGFISATGVTVIPGYPIPGVNGTQVLALKIPAGIAIGTVISYGFDISANSTSGCSSFNIFSEVKRSYSTFSCNGNACDNAFSAIIGSESNSLVVSRPSPVVNYVTYVSGNFVANDSAVVNVTITNTHPSLNAPANTLAVEFYCGVPGNKFETQMLPIPITANNSVTHQFTVHFVGSPLCATGDVLTAMIRPATSTCICDSSAYILPGVVLPVKFSAFVAKRAVGGSLLKWSITEKAVNVVFGIERSIDGINFSTIATVQGTTTLVYEYLDANPIEGIKNYYRIAQQSNATNATKTNIQIVAYLLQKEVHVLASPTMPTWQITFGNGYANQRKTIQIINANGQVIFSKELANNEMYYNVPTQSFANGNYIINIKSNGENVLVKKVTVIK